jgi:hypothetical protein
LVESKEHESNKLFGYWCLETIYILSAHLNFYFLKREYDKKIFKDMITNINSFLKTASVYGCHRNHMILISKILTGLEVWLSQQPLFELNDYKLAFFMVNHS